MNAIKSAITKLVAHDVVWKLLDKTAMPLARYADIERRKVEKHKPKNLAPVVRDAITRLMPDLKVRHGAFKGMKYPAIDAVGSALFPKLLGSYESELAPILEQICACEYTEIVDVGCAEGYYGVGLAMQIPTATVYAFDTNAHAIDLCRQMAQLNGVAERLQTGAFCDAAKLLSLPITRKALIISDCEGYEKQLFNRQVAEQLRNHDFLIETHDVIDITISSSIRQSFEATHNIEVVQSVDDIKKAQTYDYPELAGFDLKARRRLLREGRPAVMEWFWMTPRDF